MKNSENPFVALKKWHLLSGYQVLRSAPMNCPNQHQFYRLLPTWITFMWRLHSRLLSLHFIPVAHTHTDALFFRMFEMRLRDQFMMLGLILPRENEWIVYSTLVTRSEESNAINCDRCQYKFWLWSLNISLYSRMLQVFFSHIISSFIYDLWLRERILRPSIGGFLETPRFVQDLRFCFASREKFFFHFNCVVFIMKRNTGIVRQFVEVESGKGMPVVLKSSFYSNLKLREPEIDLVLVNSVKRQIMWVAGVFRSLNLGKRAARLVLAWVFFQTSQSVLLVSHVQQGHKLEALIPWITNFRGIQF